MNIPPELLEQAFGVSDIALLDPEKKQALLKQITLPMWKAGRLDFMRHSGQSLIKQAIDVSKSLKFFVLCSRRFGKSFEFVLEAVEFCLKTPNARVLYLAPTKENAAEIVTDIMPAIMEFCPDELKPSWNAQQKNYVFNIGGTERIIRLRGVNGETADNLRGGMAHLVFCDELGFWDKPEEVIQRVVLPMTMTCDGRIVCATTPSPDPSHYSASLYAELESKGATVRFTILDAPHISKAKKALYLEEAGESPIDIPAILEGLMDPSTETALREYFCRFIPNMTNAVVPEFVKYKSRVVKDFKREPYSQKFVSLDPGMVDLTAILYAEDAFIQGKLLILDESMLRAPNTIDIADTIRGKETIYWPTDTPYRLSDIDLRLISDMRRQHGLEFHKAIKKDLEAGVNLLRTYVKTEKLWIHPRCRSLILHLEMATWNNQRTKFNNMGAKSELGHFDALAALVYLVRTFDTKKNNNPYPEHYYQRGGPFGIAAEGQVYHPRATTKPKSKKNVGLLGSTPIGRKIWEHKNRNRQ